MNHIEDLLSAFNAMHKNKYQYEYDPNHIYTGNDLITIICPRHGEFTQLVRNHHKHGCKSCAMDALRARKFHTTEDCIKKFKKKHGNCYNYDSVNYINQSTPVIITCSEHGNFQQSPLIHWRGGHCPVCRTISKKQKLRKTTATFIRDAKKLWGNRWDYSKVDYFDGLTPITIGCLDHGDFSIPARLHLTGSGCPRCSNGRSDLEELWLDEKQVPISERQKRLVFEDGSYLFPDGLDEINKIVYLFMGDYWHGNPEIYPKNKVNPTLKKTFGEIYNETINDIQKYHTAGYQTIVEWESHYTPKNRLLSEVQLDRMRRIIPDLDTALRILEKIVFADQPSCPYCGSNHIWNSGKNGLYYCLEKECKKSFNARIGTIFHSSQIALHKWFYGIYLLRTTRRRITQKSLSVRIEVGREAARVILQTVEAKKNRYFIARIMTELYRMLNG